MAFIGSFTAPVSPVPPTTTYTQNDVIVSSSSSTFEKFLRQRSNDLSSAISKGISTLKHSINELFFKERALRFVKINVDVFAEREKDLRERTGSVTVLKIFFDERLIGGLVELNALRKNGDEELERRLTTPVGEGPLAPMYGFDEATEVEEAAVATYVRHHGCAPSKSSVGNLRQWPNWPYHCHGTALCSMSVHHVAH
ncbi:hypothetical protein JHK86_022735 [Glycine max]|nr:hypothetical protein JHK86_022735 [Glycine max]